MNSKSFDMCEGPLLKNLILYTIPIILTGVLQLLFNAADLAIVGQYCGELSVAAVGATGAIINLIVNLFIGLSVGAGVTVAHALGSGRDEDVRRTVHTAIPTALISGIILTVVGVSGSHYFLGLMGTPSDVIELSATYMRIYFCGITSGMIYNFGSAILRAAGDTKSPLYYLTIAGIINVILNIVFVRFFNMDVAGVALATTISQTFSAVMIIIALTRRTDNCRLYLRKIKIYRQQLLRIIRIGFPAGIQGSLFSISNVIIQSSVNSFGSVVLSGNSAAQNIEGFVYTIMNSFHQTALNFTGQNYGAGKYERLKKIMIICLLLVFGAGLTSGLTVYLLGEPLLSIYIPDSPEAISYGLIRLSYICIPYFICGLMDVATGLIRGLGSSLLPMIITVVGVCGMRISWIYTVFRIPEYHTLESLYISYTISWTLTFIAEIIVFFVIYRRITKSAKAAAVR
ncbi:MAG: MATE family efflux transporter [Ruminococcus sp.]|nr:MATE family efflux transporter [Ruminococcus sp.]